jgi:hypothetical protein
MVTQMHQDATAHQHALTPARVRWARTELSESNLATLHRRKRWAKIIGLDIFPGGFA